MYKVIVVIPTYNDAARLRLCLQALAQQSYPTEQLSVYVVDNNSTEDIRSVTEHFAFCTYLKEAKPGSYHARNLALSVFDGDETLVGFTDADCIPQPDWVEKAVARLEGAPLTVLGGKVEIATEDKHNPTLIELFEILRGFPQQEYVERDNFAVTANMFTSRKVISVNGLFNTALFSGGDLEWGVRLKQHGIPILYADEVVVRHPARTKLSQLLKKIRRTVGGAYRQRKLTPHCERLFSFRLILRGYIPPFKAIAPIASLPTQVGLCRKVTLFLLMTFLKYYQTTYQLLYKIGVVKEDERF